jgi:hypothetical protein
LRFGRLNRVLWFKLGGNWGSFFSATGITVKQRASFSKTT